MKLSSYILSVNREAVFRNKFRDQVHFLLLFLNSQSGLNSECPKPRSESVRTAGLILSHTQNPLYSIEYTSFSYYCFRGYCPRYGGHQSIPSEA